MTLLSGFAPATLPARCGSMVTGGPPSVAIFVAATPGSGKAAALICSAAAGAASAAAAGAAGAASFAGGKVSAAVAILVWSTVAEASARAGAASLCAGLSEAGIAGFAASGGEDSSGFSAVTFWGSTGAELIAACPAGLADAKGTSADGVSILGVSTAGVSTRSSARTGLAVSLVASPCCANVVSGAACHDGLLANSSWAARSSAAAPSPKTRIDSESTIAVSRKRKPGSIDASSTFAGLLQSLLSVQERGDHKIGVFTAQLTLQRAANQVDLRIA